MIKQLPEKILRTLVVFLVFICLKHTVFSQVNNTSRARINNAFSEEFIHEAMQLYDWHEVEAELARQTGASLANCNEFFRYLGKKGELNFPEYLNEVKLGNLTAANALQYWMSKMPLYVFKYNQLKDLIETYQKENNQAFKTYTGGAICNNLDFSDGTTNGWSGKWNHTKSDHWSTAAMSLPMPGLNSSGTNTMGYVHQLCTPGADPNVPAVQRVPPGHTISLRLGDDEPYTTQSNNNLPYNHQMIENSFTVTTQNNSIVYWYSVLFHQDPTDPHPADKQPYFKIRMFDQSGAEILCAHYDVNIASGAISGFKNYSLGASDEAVYKDWTQVMIPLINYVGQKVTIRFESSDCRLGGHFGYAYLAVDCGPFSVIQSTPFPCNGGTASLTAPAGAATYSWVGPGIVGASNNQQVTVNAPGKYEVTMTTLGNSGAVCTFKIDTIITKDVNVPVAAFSNNAPCLGITTVFTDASTGSGITWDWDFGDGTTPHSTQQNPTHNYAAANNYTVTLVVTNAAGCKDTIKHILAVNPIPLANFTATKECMGTATVFTDSSTPTSGLTYSWNFGNGAGTSAQQNPTYTYPNSGTFNAELIVSTASGCKDTVKVPVTVNANAVPNFKVDPVCEGATSVFNNLTPNNPPIATWAWDFTNNASVDNTTQSPTNTYTPGTYTALLTVTTATTPACTASFAKTVLVSPNPVPKFTSNRVCQGALTAFNNSATTIALPDNVATYNWDFGDGTISNTSNPQHLYPSCGKFQVKMEAVSNNGCKTTYRDSAIVKCNPVASFSATDVCLHEPTVFTNSSSISVGNIIKYDWDFNKDGTIDNTTLNPSTIYSTAGTYTVNLIVTSDSGCINSKTQQLTVFPLPVAKFSYSRVCMGTPMKFKDISSVASGSVATWAWDFENDGIVDNATKEPSFTFPKVGFQQVHLAVTSDHGCKDDTTQTLFVNPNPVPTLALDDPEGCPVHHVNLSGGVEAASVSHANSIVKWEWDFDNNAQIDSTHLYNPGKGTDNVAYNYLNNHYNNLALYAVSLTVTSDSGCVGKITSAPNFITVFPKPIPGFNWGPNDPKPDVFEPMVYFYNTALGATGMVWNFGDAVSANNTSTLFDPSHNYGFWKDGTYNVWQVVSNNYGCKDSVMNPVEIRPSWVFYIPNSFTPNNDNLNDGFRGTGFNLNAYNIWIFDRWGNKIFHSTDLDEYWDGKLNGNLVQQDVYVWKVKFQDIFGEKHEHHGTVTVVR